MPRLGAWAPSRLPFPPWTTDSCCRRCMPAQQRRGNRGGGGGRRPDRLVGRLDHRPRPGRSRVDRRIRPDLRGDPHPGPRRGAPPTTGLGTSVIVVPQRQAVVLAKELATLDVLSRGKVIAGVGIGWNRTEFANLGTADRFAVRGAYLEETVGLWRHLWGGATTPFRGRFHDLEDFVFEPLPDQGANLPIWFGGRAEVALRQGRPHRRRLPLQLDLAGQVRRADPRHPRRGDRGRPPDARAVGPRPGPPDGPVTGRPGRRLRPARQPRPDPRRDRRMGGHRRHPPCALLRVGRARGDRPRRGVVRPRGRSAHLTRRGSELRQYLRIGLGRGEHVPDLGDPVGHRPDRPAVGPEGRIVELVPRDRR